ncbi:MAG: hypothetical protein AAF721_41480 [Myxococcota bacterium]
MGGDPQSLLRQVEALVQARATGEPVDPATVEALADGYRRGAEAWPSLALSVDEFVAAALGERATVTAAALHAEDLYLATCCCLHRAGAIEAFERLHAPVFSTAIPSRLRAGGLPEDFAAVLRQRLLVGDGAPALARYGGRGALGGWLRVTVARAAISAVRKRASEARREASLPDLLGMMSAQRDPELDYLRHVYRDAFRSAFEAAVGRLSERQRSLVHLSAVRGVSVRKLGKMYGVGHSTAARWVTDAVATLSAAVRDSLAANLGTQPDELDSLMHVLDGSLELSVSRILAAK